MTLPTRRELELLITTSEQSLAYPVDKQVFYQPTGCHACGGALFLHNKLYRCRVDRCRKSTSLLKNNFFAQSRLKVNDILELAYYWLSGYCHTSVMTMTRHSSATVTEYFGHFRQLVSSSLDDSDNLIGGDGRIVEIDESKLDEESTTAAIESKVPGLLAESCGQKRSVFRGSS